MGFAPLKSKITAGLLAAMHRGIYIGTFLNKQTDPLGASLQKKLFRALKLKHNFINPARKTREGKLKSHVTLSC